MTISRKTITFYLLLILLVSFLSYLVYLYRINSATPEVAGEFHQGITANQKIVKIKDASFIADIADTDEKRASGLMNVPELDQNKGMLFIFEKPGKHGFWMKNTLIPLDIIWLDGDKKVVHISASTKPCKTSLDSLCQVFSPLKPAMYVIELNAGNAKKLGLKIGDSVEF